MKFSDRLEKLPPYLFVEIDNMKRKAISEGKDIINLGIGDPDIPTPEIIRQKMKEALDDTDNHQYPIGKGKDIFRNQVQSFMKKRFNVELDADKEIHPLIGSKEGIAHFPLAFVNPGDTVIVPEPAYPVYNSGTIFAGGKPYFVSLTAENAFMPDWSKVPAEIMEKTKVIFINYPNNPTGAMATRDFFEQTVELAHKYGIIVVHDAAYTEMYYAEPPLSFLEISGAMEVAVEFHSLSKPFSMTGWRIGWACGNETLIKGLAKVKDNIDSGVFGAIQDAGTEALASYDELVINTCSIYRERAEIMAEGLKSMDWKLDIPRATFYIWARPPGETSSIEAVKKLIVEAGVVSTPGSGFGPSGERYVRFALTKEAGRLKDALGRIKEIKWKT
ncbi:MAG: LL-diaminopimelate aminotransferase [Elusimicrobiota bacterium]